MASARETLKKFIRRTEKNQKRKARIEYEETLPSYLQDNLSSSSDDGDDGTNDKGGTKKSKSVDVDMTKDSDSDNDNENDNDNDEDDSWIVNDDENPNIEAAKLMNQLLKKHRLKTLSDRQRWELYLKYLALTLLDPNFEQTCLDDNQSQTKMNYSNNRRNSSSNSNDNDNHNGNDIDGDNESENKSGIDYQELFAIRRKIETEMRDALSNTLQSQAWNKDIFGKLKTLPLLDYEMAGDDGELQDEYNANQDKHDMNKKKKKQKQKKKKKKQKNKSNDKNKNKNKNKNQNKSKREINSDDTDSDIENSSDSDSDNITDTTDSLDMYGNHRCDACGRRKTIATIYIGLSGHCYSSNVLWSDKYTFRDCVIGDKNEQWYYFIGRHCWKRISLYHRVTHFKLDLLLQLDVCKKLCICC